MNSNKIKKYIHQHSSLFWYIPEDKKEDISNELLVETILNYGDMNAIRQLLSLMGIDEVAKHFYNLINTSERRKGNIHEITIHFFSEFFNRYVPGNI
ncbi:MAG: hypothetical protein K8R74_11920 [Bacteroidales bacterium]|nr:hypothetical protein [Bacteroidales bacterium]